MNEKKQVVNQFKPNRKLYIWMLSISMMITLCSMFIPQDERCFVIITGVGCGAIASFFVAWLIDEANCKRDSERVIYNQELLLQRLFSVFDNGLQILIIKTKDMVQDSVSQKWYEWVDAADQVTNSNPEFTDTFIRCMRVFFDDIAEPAYYLESQAAFMLEHGLLVGEDIDSLSSILVLCDLVNLELNKSDQSTLARKNKTYSSLMKAYIDYSVNLRFINETDIESKFYDLLLKHKH